MPHGPSPCHAVRMTESDRTAVDVQLLRVDPEEVAAVDRLGGERLVQFQTPMSSTLRPCCFSRRGIAVTGPMPISPGSQPVTEIPQ
jgi:hypothetical protein